MLHKATVPWPGDVGLDPPPQLGELEVEEDEEGAEDVGVVHMLAAVGDLHPGPAYV